MPYFRDLISECDTMSDPARCRELHVESLMNTLYRCRSYDVSPCLDTSRYLFDNEDRDAIIEHAKHGHEFLEGQLLDLFQSNGETPRRLDPSEIRQMGLSRGFSESEMACVVGFDSKGNRIFDYLCRSNRYSLNSGGVGE